MSVTVVGSIAFDAVKTPLGEHDRLLGGAATHFALAASFFDEVRVVGLVGDDFTDDDFAALETRGTNTDDVHRIAGGKTFFWRGEYGWDLNSRRTLETCLNVFANFQPQLCEASRASEILFLANIQPKLQLEVREQCTGAAFVALDSMDMWIGTSRVAVLDVISRVDCVILNDAELRQLTGEPSVYRAAREVLELGPSVVVAKQGQYGALAVTRESYFGLPAYPLERVVDPTGAGDAFAGGFVGYLARSGTAQFSDDVLRRAMAYGTALASFNVEDFGAGRLLELTADDVERRVRDLHRFTQFERDPVPT